MDYWLYSFPVHPLRKDIGSSEKSDSTTNDEENGNLSLK